MLTSVFRITGFRLPSLYVFSPLFTSVCRKRASSTRFPCCKPGGAAPYTSNYAALVRTMATGGDGPAVKKHQNRLANERSPYLLQHASNPVDW